MKIYVACLASYNNGVLHGRWIDAESDVVSMRDQVSAMLRESKFPNVTVIHPETGKTVPSAEEFAIHDYEDMPSIFGEYTGLKEIADYVEFVERIESDQGLNEDEAQSLATAMIENWHSVESASSELDNFIGIYDSFRDYADEAADALISSHEDLPNIVSRYFDYDAFARDLEIEMTALDLPNGVAVFHN